MRKITLCLMAFAAIGFAACTPEDVTPGNPVVEDTTSTNNDDPNGPGTPGEVPERRIKSLSANGEMIVSFKWEGDYLVSVQYKYDQGTFNLKYENDKLVRVDNEKWPEHSYEIEWNGDKIASETYSDSTIYKYTYTDGVATQIDTYHIQPDGSQKKDNPVELEWENGNIVAYKTTWIDVYGNSHVNQILMNYDNKICPLHIMQNVGGFYAMAKIFEFRGSLGFHPWNINNLTQYGTDGNSGTKYSYTYDKYGYPQTIKYTLGGESVTFSIAYYN